MEGKKVEDMNWERKKENGRLPTRMHSIKNKGKEKNKEPITCESKKNIAIDKR